MNSKKGQISTEYLILISFITFIVISILGVALFYSSQIKDTIKFNQLERFAQKIISTSESTFYSGEPSRTTINAYLPEGVTSIEITEDSLLIRIEGEGGTSVTAYPSTVPIEGNLSTSSGVKKILIYADSEKVNIKE